MSVKGTGYVFALFLDWTLFLNYTTFKLISSNLFKNLNGRWRRIHGSFPKLGAVLCVCGGADGSG
jgi:uncharacterized protein YchJ